MSDIGKTRFLWEIVENQIGDIITTQNYYRESIEHLNDYEFICNCCLGIFEKYHKLYKSHWYSDKEVGEKAHNYLVEIYDWLKDILREE